MTTSPRGGEIIVASGSNTAANASASRALSAASSSAWTSSGVRADMPHSVAPRRAGRPIPGSWVATIAAWTHAGTSSGWPIAALGVGEFSLAAARALRRAVPFDGVCVATMDPGHAAGRPGHTIENGLPEAVQPRYTEIEVAEHGLQQVHRPRARPDAGGEPERGHRREPRPQRAPSRTAAPERVRRRRTARRALGGWGGIVLLRETGGADFTPAEVATVAALSGSLAEGLRRALLFDALAGEPSDEVAGADPARPGQHARERERRRRSVAGRVRRRFRSRDPRSRRARTLGRRSARRTARLRTPSGRWLILRGSMLGDRARGDPRSAARARARAADRRGLRAHRPRARGHPARRPGALHERRSARGCSCPRTRCRTT